MIRANHSITIIDHSVDLGSDLQLHLNVGKVLPGDLSWQKGHHCVKSPVVSVELSCCLHQCFPILRVLTQIILVQLLTNLLQLRVETHHKFFVLRLTGNFISDGHQLLFGFLEDQISEKNTICIVGFDDVNCNMKSSGGLAMFLQNLFLEGSTSILLVLCCILSHLSWISSDVVTVVITVGWNLIGVLFLQEGSSTLSTLIGSLQISEVGFRLTV